MGLGVSIKKAKRKRCVLNVVLRKEGEFNLHSILIIRHITGLSLKAMDDGGEYLREK